MVEQDVDDLLFLPVHSSFKCCPSLRPAVPLNTQWVGSKLLQATKQTPTQASTITLACLTIVGMPGLAETHSGAACNPSCQLYDHMLDEGTPHQAWYKESDWKACALWRCMSQGSCPVVTLILAVMSAPWSSSCFTTSACPSLAAHISGDSPCEYSAES